MVPQAKACLPKPAGAYLPHPFGDRESVGGTKLVIDWWKGERYAQGIKASTRQSKSDLSDGTVGAVPFVHLASK
jgi:hypothetical protein